MADDVAALVFHIHPGVPHDLMGKESIFLNAHGIDHAAGAVVHLAAAMRVGVGEDNLHTA